MLRHTVDSMEDDEAFHVWDSGTWFWEQEFGMEETCCGSSSESSTVAARCSAVGLGVSLGQDVTLI